ncbi:Trm112 family protein [Corynebacterium sp. KPL2734]
MNQKLEQGLICRAAGLAFPVRKPGVSRSRGGCGGQ